VLAFSNSNCPISPTARLLSSISFASTPAVSPTGSVTPHPPRPQPTITSINSTAQTLLIAAVYRKGSKASRNSKCMLAPHPDYQLFKSKLQRHLPDAISFKGTLYRACEPIYANTRDLLTGEGSRKAGGRWNPPGAFAITYLAQTLEGALAESLGTGALFGFDPSTRLPLTLVAIDASLNAILDFSSTRIRRA